jgi:hypothetical protein
MDLCRAARLVPTVPQLRESADRLPEARGLVIVDVTDRVAIVSGLDGEQPRYYLQHALGFPVHDVRYPHHTRQHGRADIGWEGGGVR